MLQQALKQESAASLTFINCSRDAEHQIFNEQLTALEANSSVNVKRALELGNETDFSGRLTEEILLQWLPNTSADIYFCGPLPFMKSLKQILNAIGFADEQLHYEVFGPRTTL